ncbi:MAG: hypothetical protein OEY51_07895, partial [Cyclobacteriaceae bacterium]|nr:hypothetical protein [Cyclobacteriaceae bacterium]
MDRRIVLIGVLSILIIENRLSGQGLIGQDTTNRVITTAVPFLSITPDARAGGMADVGVATSPDVNSLYWNAAKLVYC